MNRVQNIRIEIWKRKVVRKYKLETNYNQVQLVLAVFVSGFLYQVSIKLY